MQPEAVNLEQRQRPRLALSLFWRTFFLLALLLIGSVLAWLQTLRSLEFEPRAIQTAQQIASLVNLSRAALIHADSIARVSLIKTMTEQEGVRIVPREPNDSFEPFDSDALGQRITLELVQRLGPGTQLANRVNQIEGLWVGFTIDDDAYWMRTDRERFNRTAGRTWLIWLMTAAALSLAGAALIARRINRPLKQLSFAASRVREGDFEASTLDETVVTSEIRAVNIGFNRMTEKLAKIEEDRAIMLAGISHDLRTPLAAITGAATTLMQDRDRLDAPTRVALLQSIASEASRLGNLVTNLLAMTRLEAGSVRPEKDWQPIEEVIGSALSRLETQLQGRPVRTDVADDLPLVAIDPTLIEQVLANFLDNALKYTPAGSPIEVRARASDGALTVEVRDWGPGLAPEEEAHVFEKFYRAAGSKGRVGSGLGLAICRGILMVHGGRTWVERRRDGTTFAFSLPLGEPPPPLTEEPASAPPSLRDSSRGATLSPP